MKNYHHINWRGWIIICLALLIGILSLLLCIIRPLVLEYAQHTIQQTASYAIHDTISNKIYANRSQYSQLISLERDNSNRVTALKTDTILADYLKVEITRATYEALNTLKESKVSIPIGSILLPSLFAGRGPALHVGIASLGYADADFISAFTSAGINQTRHQILLEIRAEARLITALGARNIKVSNSIIVTDTVIVGTVPDSYTYIDDTEQSLLGKVNDYAGQ